MRDATLNELIALSRAAMEWGEDNARSLVSFGATIDIATPALIVNFVPKARPGAGHVIPIDQALDPTEMRMGLSRALRGEPISRRDKISYIPLGRGPAHN